MWTGARCVFTNLFNKTLPVFTAVCRVWTENKVFHPEYEPIGLQRERERVRERDGREGRGGEVRERRGRERRKEEREREVRGRER